MNLRAQTDGEAMLVAVHAEQVARIVDRTTQKQGAETLKSDWTLAESNACVEDYWNVQLPSCVAHWSAL